MGSAPKGKRRNAEDSPERIFCLLRKRIAEELQRDDLKVKDASQLELAIGTFAPSELVEGFKISDYPFIGSRYVSVRDGHVYVVAGSVDDGSQVKAYRVGFLQSVFTVHGGIAVGITEDGWMDSVMVMFSMNHASFHMVDGVIADVDDALPTRRSYPLKKLKAYRQFVKNTVSKFLNSKG